MPIRITTWGYKLYHRNMPTCLSGIIFGLVHTLIRGLESLAHLSLQKSTLLPLLIRYRIPSQIILQTPPIPFQKNEAFFMFREKGIFSFHLYFPFSTWTQSWSDFFKRLNLTFIRRALFKQNKILNPSPPFFTSWDKSSHLTKLIPFLSSEFPQTKLRIIFSISWHTFRDKFRRHGINWNSRKNCFG